MGGGQGWVGKNPFSVTEVSGEGTVDKENNSGKDSRNTRLNWNSHQAVPPLGTIQWLSIIRE